MNNMINNMKNEYIKNARIGETLDLPMDKGIMDYDESKKKFQFSGSLPTDTLANIYK